MNKKQIIVISLFFVIILLSGCLDSDRIRISGTIIDQYGNRVEGIKVLCKGTKEITNHLGNFTFTVPNVEIPTDLDITFNGDTLGFETSTRPVRVLPETNKDIGYVELKRIKAMLYGEVTYSAETQSMAVMDTNEVGLPTRPKTSYPEGEIIVKFKDSAKTQGVSLLSKDIGLEVVKKSSDNRFFTVKTAGNIDTTIQSLKVRPDVEYAEPNYYIYPLGVTQPDGINQPESMAQFIEGGSQTLKSESTISPSAISSYAWNLEAINVPLTWDLEEGSYNTTVAVLDTGIQRGLIDLEQNIDWELGWDFVENDNDPSVWWNTHGTQVASIIGAVPNNGTGINGINHQVSIVPIRILNSVNNDGYWGNLDDLLLAMEHAINMGVDIINLSVAVDLPLYKYSEALNDLIDMAENAGILIIAAAGNDKDSTPVYPASHSRILSVGAVGPTLQPASYTNGGVDIYAPGGDYYLYPAGKQNTILTLDSWAQGTSIASAHVAGVAALLKANEPYLSPQQMRNRLKNSSLKLAYDETGDPGLLDAYRAVDNKDHGRIFVFVGQEDYQAFTYDTKESTYTYNKSGRNMYQISTVPAGWQWVYAWVDRDASGTLSAYDYFAERHVFLKEGEQAKIDFNLGLW